MQEQLYFIFKNKFYLYKIKKYRWIKIISSKIKYKQNKKTTAI
jgi:hypothetical protein